MAKRSATSELNHDNWDKEEEPEEPGVFQKASSDVLETRVIRTAKRRVKLSDSTESKPSPFSGFTGFGTATSTSTTSSPFSFLSQNKFKTTDSSDKNGAKQENNLSKLTSGPQFKSFSNTTLSGGQDKNTMSFSTSPTEKSRTTTSSDTFKPFEHVFKQSKPTYETDKKSQNLEILKDLNLSCSSWISEHLEKNPYCILTPIFKDYEKHLAQIDLDTAVKSKDNETGSEKISLTSNSITETDSPFNSKKGDCVDSKSPEKEKEAEKEQEKEKEKNIKYGGSITSNTNTNFGCSPFGSLPPFGSSPSPFGTTPSPFGTTPSPFSLNQISAKPVTEMDGESKKDDEESEEPPQNDFVPVVEEDSIYDIKCKVFVKKDGNFVSRGVGTLFLKPVKDSNKTQAVVRAHTSLGNILLNILLTPGMPIQKKGKNNAMIVCIPTPESKPPPVPVLIRVKTSEECDMLIKKLEECRGS